MARNKTFRFEQNKVADNVIEPNKPLFDQIKGKWNELFFKNNNPIVLELACGRGEYTIGLAKNFPDKNFIGIDIKGDRLWKGSQKAIEENLTNVAFLRIHIEELENYFAVGEANEIWIIHPDPRPKKRDARRRLTSPRFLSIYKNILQNLGTLRLKTDSTILYEYSLEVFQSTLLQPIVKNLTYTADLY
ncbi:MAG: tRNA (guanosine(46)-N7)-methyltransferase TrmB, partial [Thermoflexibacteraceae bacterium]